MNKEAQNYDVILAPVVTEKSTQLSEYNQVMFKVAIVATKPQIKEAVEALFDVRVLKVRTLVQPSKRKTMGRTVGRVPKWKKAYITLHPDDPIEGLEG